MSLIATGQEKNPKIELKAESIPEAVDNAGKKIRDPNRDPKSTTDIEDTAKQLVIDIAKALQPNTPPDVALKLLNNGIDPETAKKLGAYMLVFQLGLEMSFSGVPGFNPPKTGIPAIDQKEIFKKLLNEATGPDLQKVMAENNLPTGETFRYWKS